MKMLVDILDAKAERRHRKELLALANELAEMKQDLVLACRHARALRNGMIEHAVGSKPSVCDTQRVRIDPPDLDTQTLRRASARHIDRVNGNAACHDVPPMNAAPW